MRHGKWFIILPPMLYLLVFFLIPFAFALKISFADTALRVCGGCATWTRPTTCTRCANSGCQ